MLSANCNSIKLAVFRDTDNQTILWPHKNVQLRAVKNVAVLFGRMIGEVSGQMEETDGALFAHAEAQRC